jgi:hypothetical protein
MDLKKRPKRSGPLLHPASLVADFQQSYYRPLEKLRNNEAMRDEEVE